MERWRLHIKLLTSLASKTILLLRDIANISEKIVSLILVQKIIFWKTLLNLSKNLPPNSGYCLISDKEGLVNPRSN